MPSTSAVAGTVGVSIPVSLKEYHLACVVDPSPLLRLFFVPSSCYFTYKPWDRALSRNFATLLRTSQFAVSAYENTGLLPSGSDCSPFLLFPISLLSLSFQFPCLVLTFPRSISHYSLTTELTTGTNISLNGGMKSKT